MADVIVKEIIVVEASLAELNSQDKLLVTFEKDGKEYKIATPYREIKSETDVKTVLTQAIARMREKKREVKNISKQWKGVYKI